MTSYISIRDDSGVRSFSKNERDFLRDCALSSKKLRLDGRGANDVRRIQLHLSRSAHNGAECTVQWGETRVSSQIIGELIPPSPDRSSEGVISISVDLSPMASSLFGMAPPVTTTPGEDRGGHFSSTSEEEQKLLSNRILRCLERTILVGGALDAEALCVQAGAWVWKLTLKIRILDHGGNLLDATVLAAMAALRHYRKPQVDATGGGPPQLLHSDSREPTPLPLHHTPLSISFALIPADDTTQSASMVATLVDPTDREELIQTGTVSLAMNVHSEVCLLDFGGGCELQPTVLRECWHIAEKSVLQLCNMLEKTLVEADTKAQNERLQRLQKMTHGTFLGLPPSVDTPSVPFWQDEQNAEVDTKTPFADTTQEAAQAEAIVKDQQQEKIRLQALEYNLGHVAAKVKEDRPSKKKQNTDGKSSLLTAMLDSVKKSEHDDQKDKMDIDEPVVKAEKTSGTDLQSEKARNEFEQFASKKKTETAARKAKTTQNDSDDEEPPTVLKSEFDIVAPKEKEVDDLAMAIKSKKKKKKKK